MKGTSPDSPRAQELEDQYARDLDGPEEEDCLGRGAYLMSVVLQQARASGATGLETRRVGGYLIPVGGEIYDPSWVSAPNCQLPLKE